MDAIRTVLPELRGHPLYVTIDVDVLDPAEAPGTGSPEPGGLRVPELIDVVRLLGECLAIGGGLVAVAPDHPPFAHQRAGEHTSELQSLKAPLCCRMPLSK